MATETLDIDATVKAVETGFKTFLVRILVTQGVIKCPILANPWFNRIVYDVADWAVGKILREGDVLAFFFNNKIINLDKKSDYVEAVNKVESLPDDVDDHTWEVAEREASEGFRNLYGLAR